MLKFKLMRIGKKREPHYRIIVAEARSKRNGEYVDMVGQYHAVAKDNQIILDEAKVKEWLKNGAQPTETVHDIFAKFNLLPKREKVEKRTAPKAKKK